ncbi:MAG: TonB-dependent receptor [Bacteroidetes bacterium]|nr:TonB-dependent receptor [Bacteroidota bacterium]
MKWETSESYDLGLDLSMLKGSIDITADYFKKYTRDMILTNAPDAHLGVSQGPVSNVGTVQNSGFEFSLTYKGKIDGLRYSISGNLATIKNELLDLNNYTSEYIYHENNVRGTLYPFRSEPGQELYSFYLITCEGTFKSQSEIDAHVGPSGQLIQPNAKPGDLKFKDLNGDGVINNDDKSFKGNAFPDFTYGLNITANYKNFDSFHVFQGVSGAKLFNGYKYSTYNTALQGYNLDNRVLDAWSETNTGSDIPLLRVDDPNSNFGTNSDWYLEDASYLRMKNLTIGYNMPVSLMNKVSQGASMRIYVSAENLFTITNYSGLDPEIGGIGLDIGNYPLARIFSAGLSLKF